MRQQGGCFNETKDRLMSAKRNLSEIFELKSTVFFYLTLISENNFAS